MWKALIVDDEPLARDELKYLLLKSDEVEILGEASNIKDAIKSISCLQPNIVFLDIHLSGESGLDIAEFVKMLPDPPLVIFTTAYDKFALKAFDLNVFDYILKPIEEKRLFGCLERCRKIKIFPEKASTPLWKEKIAIPVDGRIILVDVQDIIYVSMNDKKSIIKTEKMEFRTNEALSAIEEKLHSEKFIKVHRSYTINYKHVLAIEPWFNSTYILIMTDHSKIPVSRTYIKEMKSKFDI